MNTQNEKQALVDTLLAKNFGSNTPVPICRLRCFVRCHIACRITCFVATPY